MSTRKTGLAITLLVIICLSGLLLSSCGSSAVMDSNEVSYEYAEESYAPTPGADKAGSSAEQGYTEVKRVDGVGSESALRYVIRNGSIDLTVQNTRDTIKSIQDMVTAADGIISYSYVYEIREGVYGASLTIRVPQERFDAMMTQLEPLGKAANIQTGQDDVTMQYVDLESRLNNQKAQEARLVEILEMANNVEEVLEVERELYRVRGEIESMTAQFRYLSDQVNYSTIEVSIKEEINPTQSISPGPFDKFGERLLQSFIGGVNFVFRAISAVVVALVALLPVIVLLGIIGYLIWIITKRAARKKQAAAEEKKQ
jgi:hypothetical protein